MSSNRISKILWALSAHVVNYLSLFALHFFLAKKLAPEQYGYIPFTIGIVTLFQMLADFGITTSAGKYITEYNTKDESKVNTVFYSGLILTLFLSILFTSVCFWGSNFISEILKKPEIEHFLRIASFLILFNVLSRFLYVTFQGLKKFNFVFINMCLFSFSRLVIAIFFVYLFSNKVTIVIAAYNISAILTVILSFALLYIKLKNKIRTKIQFDKDNAFEIFKYAFPLAIASISYYFYTKIDNVILGYFLDISQVSYYSIAVNVYVIPLILTQSFVMVLGPTVTENFTKKRFNYLENLFNKTSKVSLIYSLFAVIVIWFLVEPLFNLFLPRYLNSVLYIKILSFLIIFKSLGFISVGGFLTPTKFAKYSARVVLISSLLNLVLDLILIPSFGVLGCVIGTLVVHGGGNLLGVYYVTKKLNIALGKDIGRIIKVILFNIPIIVLTTKWCGNKPVLIISSLIVIISLNFVYLIYKGIISNSEIKEIKNILKLDKVMK